MGMLNSQFMIRVTQKALDDAIELVMSGQKDANRADEAQAKADEILKQYR